MQLGPDGRELCRRDRDVGWLLANKHLLDAVPSMTALLIRTGLMAYDSARCADGKEITTYDSLDESLGQARANTYLACKCWATWLGLELMSRLRIVSGDIPAEPMSSLSEPLAETLINSGVDGGIIPAVLEKNNPGYESRILPIAESLVYPAYWLSLIKSWPSTAAGDAEEMLVRQLHGPLTSAIRRNIPCGFVPIPKPAISSPMEESNCHPPQAIASVDEQDRHFPVRRSRDTSAPGRGPASARSCEKPTPPTPAGKPMAADTGLLRSIRQRRSQGQPRSSENHHRGLVAGRAFGRTVAARTTEEIDSRRGESPGLTGVRGTAGFPLSDRLLTRRNCQRRPHDEHIQEDRD